MNHHLDDHLRDALRREEPPADFADRILARLPDARPVVIELPVRRRLAPRFALAAAAALVAVAAGSAWLATPHGALEAQRLPEVAWTPATRSDAPKVSSLGPVEPAPTPPSRQSPIQRVKWTPPPRPREDDVEAQRAAEQLRLALHITGDKLNVARHEVREALAVPES